MSTPHRSRWLDEDKDRLDGFKVRKQANKGSIWGRGNSSPLSTTQSTMSRFTGFGFGINASDGNRKSLRIKTRSGGKSEAGCPTEFDKLCFS